MKEQLIEFLEKNAVSEINGMLIDDVAAHFQTTRRKISQLCEEINTEIEYSVIIGNSNFGIYLCTPIDIDKAIRREFRRNITGINKARKMAYKAKLHGQSQINVETLEMEIYESLKQPEVQHGKCFML